MISVVFSSSEGPSSIAVFPTVATQEITIRLSHKPLESGLIIISNFTGQVVRQMRIGPGLLQQTIDVSQLPSGHYVVVYRGGPTVQTARFIRP